MRDGKARLGRGTESVTLTTAMPAVLASTSFALFDDFEGASLDTARWNNNSPAGGYSPGVGTDNGSKRAYGGTDSGGPDPGAARDLNNANNADYGAPIGVDDAGIADTGTWQFDITTNNNSAVVTHGVFFFGGTTGGYIFEASGAGGTTWKIIKTSLNPNGGSNNWLNQVSDTVLGTYAAQPTCYNTPITVKITRDSSGNFEVFASGASIGTFTDTTYTTNRFFSFAGFGGGRFAYARIDNVYFPGQATTINGFAAKFISYYNSLYTCWDSGGAAFAFTTMRTASAASNLPKIVHQNANDICTWQRDNSPTGVINTYLAAVNSTTIRCYNNETQVLTASTTVYGNSIVPLNSTTLLVIGTISSIGSGIPAIEIIKMDAGAWTIASQVVIQFDGATAGRVSSYACLDSNGALYFATSDKSTVLGTQPSRLFYATATDLLATNPTLTAQYSLSDFVCNGVFNLAGVVYLFGSRIRGTDAFAAILKYPGTPIYESTKAISLASVISEQNFYNHGIPCVWKNLDHALFLSNTDLDLWEPILQMNTSNQIVEVAAFDSGQFDSALPNFNAIAEWNGVFYCLNAQAGTIRRTTTTRGGLVGDPTTCVLELSQMGANTDLINKTLYSVTIELSAAVPASETLTVYVNGTSVGTMVAASGTRKEIVLTSELTAASFIVKLSWPKASTWTGYIKNGPIIRYIPTQFKKRAWGFGIRATKRLKMGDGSHHPTSPTTMFSDIEACWSSNVPITFIDVDGTSYTVIVTDFKQKRPLLQIARSSDQEAFYFVEVLEV